jgi:predicted DsbA family dithiol-disulfide isomerase
MLVTMASAAKYTARMDSGRFRIVAYADYVCPWCYIGFRRIEQLQREFDVGS